MHEGFAWKKASAHGGWQRRWFFLQEGLLCYTAPADEQSAVVCGKLLGAKMLTPETGAPPPKREAGGRLQRTLSYTRRRRQGGSSEGVELALQTDHRLYVLRMEDAGDAAAWLDACLRLLAKSPVRSPVKSPGAWVAK